jgi:hypothetical protein
VRQILGDVSLLFGGLAVAIVGSSANPVEKHLERDIDVDDVLEPVAEPALIFCSATDRRGGVLSRSDSTW